MSMRNKLEERFPWFRQAPDEEQRKLLASAYRSMGAKRREAQAEERKALRSRGRQKLWPQDKRNGSQRFEWIQPTPDRALWENVRLGPAWWAGRLVIERTAGAQIGQGEREWTVLDRATGWSHETFSVYAAQHEAGERLLWTRQDDPIVVLSGYGGPFVLDVSTGLWMHSGGRLRFTTRGARRMFKAITKVCPCCVDRLADHADPYAKPVIAAVTTEAELKARRKEYQRRYYLYRKLKLR